MILFYKACGYEFFYNYDDSADVYEIFLDKEGETYIGCCDGIREAHFFAQDYIEEQTS